MPRQAHGRSLHETGPARTRKRKPAKGRGLNALETAEKQFPEKIKIRQHRLGEAEDDSDVPVSRQHADERSPKRRKIENAIDAHDSAEEGSDPDGNPWHVGVDEDDEDSDIDSDDAFGESDEERFADFTFRGSAQNEDNTPKPKKTKVSHPHLDLAEEDADDGSDGTSEGLDDDTGDEDDDLGEDAVDLAAALDMNEEEDRKEREQSSKKGRSKKDSRRGTGFDSSEDSAASGAEDESDGEEEEDAYAGFSVSEDEGDEETTARLRNFIDGLTPAQKDKAAKPKSHSLPSLPDKPSQFALPSAGLSAGDLMQYVKDPTQRQSLKILQAGEREEPSNHKGAIPGKLAAPLAKRQQDRLDRLAAYDKSKQTMERWVDTVKQNRRAEHVSFPLQDPAMASATNVKSLQPINRSHPQSELETKIQEIMRESGFQTTDHGDEEGQLRKYEELLEKKVPLEEVQARRRELRMQRELMFREEVRAKRIKKIKSKAYRRVHRKEKDKFAVQERERLAAAGILNSDEEREHNDRRRAEERMGARHRESKWAKSAKVTGQTTWNDDAKVGVSEMARRDEELRRRIEGRNMRGSDESGSGSDLSSEYDSDEDDMRWNEKLDSLEAKEQLNGKSKLADMAFMKKAEASRKAQNDEELRLLRKSMNGDGDELSDTDSEIDAPTRQKYGNATIKQKKESKQLVARNEFEEHLSEDEVERLEENVNTEADHHPQIQTASKRPGGPAKVALVVASRDANQLSDTKRFKKAADASKIKLEAPNTMEKSQPSELNDYTSPSESEHEQSGGLDAKDRLAMDIFAGDDEEDLRKQFETEKKEAVDEEGDQIVDNTLPGWGSWAGAGISKREQKKAKGRFLTTIKGVAPEARKDAKLDRVIVNEKRVKKNGKYLATELPHPFESRQQYERSLRLPMGPEWSTRNHFQDAIKPRVLLKQGQVIKPIARPMA
ncbi:hypothetical protein H2198_007334 [Neophaeococcomyces mojaviensis]|uniref:Uncharacterized protein n=1 Tax=Neophaeococcomyces mojaviensis TaxID=3383035 RepID=A0ACC3A102_9EURO|nr:hypothetical protein H2198_007334 [Knufia sp. JES_112]